MEDDNTPPSQSKRKREAGTLDDEAEVLARVEAEIEEAGERERRGHATRPPRQRGRTTPIAVRFDEFTIKRLKDLAARRNTGYQTLLKEFVIERLYEEEKRERIVE